MSSERPCTSVLFRDPWHTMHGQKYAQPNGFNKWARNSDSAISDTNKTQTYWFTTAAIRLSITQSSNRTATTTGSHRPVIALTSMPLAARTRWSDQRHCRIWRSDRTPTRRMRPLSQVMIRRLPNPEVDTPFCLFPSSPPPHYFTIPTCIYYAPKIIFCEFSEFVQ